MSEALPLICNPDSSPTKEEKELRKFITLQATAQAISEAPNPAEVDELGFGPKCLVAASLPYKKPDPDKLTETNGCWVKTNGNYTLWVQGGPGGLPFGIYPRLRSPRGWELRLSADVQPEWLLALLNRLA